MHGSKLFRCNVHLKITTEKKHQLKRAFYDGIINLSEQLACVKKKQWPAKYLGRSSGEGEAELCSKSMEFYESFRVYSWNAPGNNMKIFRKKLDFQPYHLQLTQHITADDKHTFVQHYEPLIE
ncbi:hypothetical protein TNCV_3552231 [Trichonephila clavipes]|nr:hypothetical protein TNCV_3552231 [Trichonephila clavipes]